MDLDVMRVERDAADWVQAQSPSVLTPARQLEQGVAFARAADETRRACDGAARVRSGPVLQTLARHGVRCALIEGAGRGTIRLSAALTELDARVRSEGVDGSPPSDHDATAAHRPRDQPVLREILATRHQREKPREGDAGPS